MERFDEYDVVVVGAGFGGLYAVHRLREDGFSVLGLEQGSGVGGTWFWNRYPGARCDIPSVAYSYSFSDDLQQKWDWSERYAAQPEIERYLNHVADRFALRDDIEFNSRVTEAVLDEDRETWTVTVEGRSRRISARYLLLATGGFSKPFVPSLPGVDIFQGELYTTQAWPSDVDLTGKRIGVIGTGSSGMQTATAVAQQDPERLFVFQRTPNYAVPGLNRPTDAAEMARFKNTYREYRKQARHSGSGMVLDGPAVRGAEMSDEEFEAHMEYSRSVGGVYVYSGVVDFTTNDEVNQRLQDDIRQDIARRVKDPEVARKLTPRGYPLGVRRVLIENGYFEIYNKPNVELVDLLEEGDIERLSETGVVTATRDIPLDMVIFATGFDSGTGAILAINPKGRCGVPLSEKWAEGYRNYLGLLVNGYPNMFTITGPGSPSIRSQVVVSIEQHVDLVADLLRNARESGLTTLEATAESETRWTEHVDESVEATVLARYRDTQYWGANVPGKPGRYLAYVGGVGYFREICDRVAAEGYPGVSWKSPAPESSVTSVGEWDGHAEVSATSASNTVV